MCASPLHHERVFLLHGEMRIDLYRIILVLELQQLLSTLVRHQAAVIDDIWGMTSQFQFKAQRGVTTQHARSYFFFPGRSYLL